MCNKKSLSLHKIATNFMPGGVNSPVRAFNAVERGPLYIRKAKGSRILDVDDNEYIDYVSSWGVSILGHANDEVCKEINLAISDGLSFGAPTEKEIILAQMICEAVESVEMVRMVSSGTEAVMSAIRLARGYTDRDMIIKFEGCYHGHSDSLLVKAGSGGITTGVPDSKGIPYDIAKNTLTTPYNDKESLEDIFKKFGKKIAAVVVEPVAANMGVILPDIEFLKLMRELTNKYGSVLIFDEVITGFRLGYRCAQGSYGITPDLTTFGKIIGGGMPIGAYGGKRDIMKFVSPIGPVYQAGTLSGNPIAMTAGIKTLEILRDNPSIYTDIEDKAKKLENAYIKAGDKYNIPCFINRAGSLMSVFFTNGKVSDYNTASKCDTKRFAEYFNYILEEKIYIAPSQYESLFVSYAHTDEDIEITIDGIYKAFSSIGSGW